MFPVQEMSVGTGQKTKTGSRPRFNMDFPRNKDFVSRIYSQMNCTAMAPKEASSGPQERQAERPQTEQRIATFSGASIRLKT